jgi:hypothetical protein
MTSEIPDDRQTINETLEKYFLSLSEEHELTLDEIRKIFNECDTKLISGGGYKARQFMEIALVPAIERYKKVKQEDKS